MKKIYKLAVPNFGAIYVRRPSARIMETFVENESKPDNVKGWLAAADVVASCLVKGPKDDTRRYASRDELLDDMDADEYLAVAPVINQWNNDILGEKRKNLPRPKNSATD